MPRYAERAYGTGKTLHDGVFEDTKVKSPEPFLPFNPTTTCRAVHYFRPFSPVDYNSRICVKSLFIRVKFFPTIIIVCHLRYNRKNAFIISLTLQTRSSLSPQPMQQKKSIRPIRS